MSWVKFKVHWTLRARIRVASWVADIAAWLARNPVQRMRVRRERLTVHLW